MRGFAKKLKPCPHEVAIECKRGRHAQGMHHRKAQTVREAESRIPISLVEVQGSTLDVFVRSDDPDDMTGQETPGKPNGLVGG